MIIIIHAYEEGRAPILLVNHSCVAVDVHERKDLLLQLPPERACYYAWRMPNGNRSLTWGSGKNQVSKDVRKSAMGSFKSTVAGMDIHWVSFLHNRQRILLFTADPALAIQLSYDTPTVPVEQVVTVSLHSLAVSLIDNIQRKEILYASITSSGIIWETARMDRSRTFYRAMSIRDNLLLEEAYQQYYRSLTVNPETDGRREVDSGRMLVDFKQGRIYKPKERILRRSYRSGVELLYESYCNRTLIHARLNKIQVDNQLEDCVFPVVFAPVPPPRSLATESVPHPFVEISVVQLVGQRTEVPQFEYFKLLVQECHIRVDMSLLNAIGNFLVTENDLKSEWERKKNIRLDMQAAMQGSLLPDTVPSKCNTQ